MPRSLCRIAGLLAKISALRSRSLGKVSALPAPGGAAGLSAGAVDGRAGAVAISATADPSGYLARPSRAVPACRRFKPADVIIHQIAAKRSLRKPSLDGRAGRCWGEG